MYMTCVLLHFLPNVGAYLLKRYCHVTISFRSIAPSPDCRNWTLIFHMATDVSERALELKDLVHLLHHRTAQWRALGLQLGVPKHVLDTIQSNHAGYPDMAQSCLTATLSWCLRKGRVFTQKDVSELSVTRGANLYVTFLFIAKQIINVFPATMWVNNRQHGCCRSLLL